MFSAPTNVGSGAPSVIHILELTLRIASEIHRKEGTLQFFANIVLKGPILSNYIYKIITITNNNMNCDNI